MEQSLELTNVLHAIQKELTEIRGDINTKVAQSQGRHAEIDARITALEQTCAERNRAVHHQLTAIKTLGVTMIATVVTAAGALLAALILG